MLEHDADTTEPEALDVVTAADGATGREVLRVFLRAAATSTALLQRVKCWPSTAILIGPE